MFSIARDSIDGRIEVTNYQKSAHKFKLRVEHNVHIKIRIHSIL